MRKISIVLVFLLLLQAIPINFFNFAEDLTPEELVNLSDEKIANLTDQQIIDGITSDDDYPFSRSGKLFDNFRFEGEPIRVIDVSLNVETFRKYKQIVYGNPFNSQKNYEGKILPKSEAKFLGFNNQGKPVTNDLYPGDSGGIEPPDKKWLFDDNEYERSWDQVSKKVANGEDISELYRHMLTTDTINTDSVGSYTLAEILEKRMGNLTAYLDSPIELREKLESVAQLQTLPTFVSKGSFIMRHNTKGFEQYDTMEWNKIGKLNHSITITPEKDTIIMFPDQDEVTNKFTVTVNYDNKIGGMDTVKLLEDVIATRFGDENKSVPSDLTTYTVIKTYRRENYNSAVHTVNEQGNYRFKSIFGDLYKGVGNGTFTLDVKMKGDLAVDFITKHDSKICDDYLNPIVLNEGSWDSSDDIVKIDLEDKSIISQALVNEIPDAKIISWNWFVKNKDGNFEQFNSTLTPNISYDLAFGSDYAFNMTKEDGRVESLVQFKLEVIDSQGNSGELIKNVKVSDGPPPIPPTPVSKNKKPHAIVKVKNVVKAGEKVWADGRDSYDSDGRIVSYDWDSPHSVFPEADDLERVYFYAFNVTENSELRLKVKDNDDLSSSEEVKYDVVNPISPLITQTGFRKVNRKINLNAYKSKGTKYFPIQWDKTEWKITPMEGQSMDSIKIDGDLSGASIDTLFKETGKYKVWMKLYTTCTYEDEEYSYSNETEQFIWIKPDEAPISNINVKKLTYRNPDTDGIAILQVADDSRSLDGDFIENKKWWFAFDSDNDGSFEDEEFVLISDGNENVIYQSVNHVGKYLFKLEVKETFGHPTIEKFVTDADRERDDNTDVAESLRIVEVKNVAPIVELNIEPREPKKIPLGPSPEKLTKSFHYS